MSKLTQSFTTVSRFCPESHLWPFNKGDSCCKFLYKATDPTREIQFEDLPQECPEADTIPCPDNTKCRLDTTKCKHVQLTK